MAKKLSDDDLVSILRREPTSEANLVKRVRSRLLAQSRQNGDCLEWMGHRIRTGYGRLRVNGRMTLIHRAAWIDRNGPIPEGMCVCHTCDNPPCWNTDHLFLGTQGDNNKDRHQKGRSRGGRLQGEKHHQARLSVGDVLAIRASVDRSGDLAERYGMTQSNINSIRSGRRWSHVHG
jgi:hypothetical protein